MNKPTNKILKSSIDPWAEAMRGTRRATKSFDPRKVGSPVRTKKKAAK